jgi:hypothetical protein
MGNRKARELMVQKERDALWERIRTEARPARSDVHAIGIGVRRIQLIVCPSFEQAIVWDVRQGPNGWQLYRPREVDSSIDLNVIGYDEVQFESSRLASFFDRVTAISMPIKPDLSGFGGADGTGYELAVFGDLWSSWRFKWWSESPRQWLPLVEITNEMIAAFSNAENENNSIAD